MELRYKCITRGPNLCHFDTKGKGNILVINNNLAHSHHLISSFKKKKIH